MDWTKPIALTLPQNATPFQRIVAMIGHMDCRFYCTKKAYVEVGGGSLPLVENLAIIPAWVEGRAGRIGRFCEAHKSAQIIVQGEHANDLPVNITFTALPIMGDHYEAGIRSERPFEIGSGVVISSGAKVLPGVRIGDGAVIGAGAIVTRDVEPFAIVAGVPARQIKARGPFPAWWDMPVADLLSGRDRLQEVALAFDPSNGRKDRPPIEIHLVDGSFTVRPPQGAPPQVSEYLAQALSAPNPYWLADCWAE